MDDDNDKGTSLAGVQGDDTSLAGVPIPTTTITTTDDDDDSDAESDHNSIDPNEADKSSMKHPYTALEAMHQFTVRLVNMRKSWMAWNYLSWKPKFLYYVDPKEFLYHHLTTYPKWEARPMP